MVDAYLNFSRAFIKLSFVLDIVSNVQHISYNMHANVLFIREASTNINFMFITWQSSDHELSLKIVTVRCQMKFCLDRVYLTV